MCSEYCSQSLLQSCDTTASGEITTTKKREMKMNELKMCTRPDCKVKSPQPKTNFMRDARNADGLTGHCRTCKSEYNKARWIKEKTAQSHTARKIKPRVRRKWGLKDNEPESKRVPFCLCHGARLPDPDHTFTHWVCPVTRASCDAAWKMMEGVEA